MENIESSSDTELDELISKYSPFIFEIRKRIIITIIVFAVAAVVGFIFYEIIIKFIISTLNLKGINIVFTTPFQFFDLAINCGIATGLVLTFPLMIYQILSFLKPAMKGREFKMVLILLPFSIILFLFGFSFGVYTMRWQIQSSFSKSVELGIGNILDISHLIGTVLFISVIMGLAFQFPVVLIFLLRLGIVKAAQISKKRLWVYFGALIFIIILPVDSIIADIILAIPLLLLFECTLIFNRLLGHSG